MTTKTWDGTTNDWYNDNGADWSPAGDPAATDQVIIDSGEAYLNSGDAGFTVASITLSSSGVLAIADPGVTQAVTGKFVNSGGFYVDTASGLGGSTVTIGGTLTNSGTLQIGPSDFSLSSPDQVTASHLNNTGTIALYGSGNGAPLEQATLDITSGAAPATLTGQVFIQGDALLEYASGKITSIGSGAELYLNGTGARVADASDTTSNSALTQLASNAGDFELYNGAAVSTTTGLANNGNIYVDQSGSGGSTLTIGGGSHEHGSPRCWRADDRQRRHDRVNHCDGNREL